MVNLKREDAPEIGEDVENSLQNLGIDPAFVVAPEHRPTNPITPLQQQQQQQTENIPVIDLSGDESEIVEQVRKGSEEWGFFQLVNHGVPITLLETLETEAKQFFSLPLEEKLKIKRSSYNPLGYYDSELTKNTRDWKEVFDFFPRGETDIPPEFNQVYENQWPAGRDNFRKACESWAKAVDELSFRILELLARSLGLPPKHFHQFFDKDDTSLMRLNFYGKCPVPDLVLGVSRHKDQGALTVLVQDEVGGLEVQRKDGEWIRVTPRRDAFVINVGDLMQVWSNDLYHSVEHRVVVNENRDRFSCPFFMFPSYKSTIEPVRLLTDEAGNPPRYSAFNWGEFDKNRKDSNFKRLGVENLQIYHYAIA